MNQNKLVQSCGVCGALFYDQEGSFCSTECRAEYNSDWQDVSSDLNLEVALLYGGRK